jgi:hypothetical protein
MNNKIFSIMFTLLFLISLTSAFNTQTSIGDFNQFETALLCQVCNDATYITYNIRNPDGELIIFNETFENLGGGLFCSNFTDTTKKGIYQIFGTSDGCMYNYASDFYIKDNQEGVLFLDTANPYLLVFFGLMLVIGIILFFMNKAFKIIGSVIFLVIGLIVLFSGFSIILGILLLVVGVIMIFMGDND